MGLPGFWKAFGNEDTTNLFQYAADHFARHKRPLRIAVDFAYWWNHSVGEEKTIMIREETERLSNPIEKNSILYPTLRCFKHGIQLVFVFDGKDRPRKRGRVITSETQRAEDNRNRLAEETLSILQVPWIKAPGEAEAECVELERLGFVDAVWTDDSDAFMFGAATIIRHAYDTNKDGTKSKSNTYVRLMKTETLAQSLGVPNNLRQNVMRDGGVIYHTLCGGDYIPSGRKGWGPVAAKKVMLAVDQVGGGLWGATFVKAFHNNALHAWKTRFDNYCRKERTSIVEPGWLHHDVLQNCIQPKVSSESDLQASLNWDPASAISHDRLRNHMVSKFNFSVQEYLQHVIPFLLVRHLLQSPKMDFSIFGIEVGKAVSRKGSGNVAQSTIVYHIESIVSCDILKSWPRKDTKALSRIRPYEHNKEASTEVLNYILESALPEAMAGRVPKGAPRSNRTGQSVARATEASGAVAVNRKKRGRPTNAEKAAKIAKLNEQQPKSVMREEKPSRPRPANPTFTNSSAEHHQRPQPLQNATSSYNARPRDLSINFGCHKGLGVEQSTPRTLQEYGYDLNDIDFPSTQELADELSMSAVETRSSRDVKKFGFTASQPIELD